MSQFDDDSLYISDEIYERTIKTPKGDKTFWFKELPSNAHTRFEFEIRSDDYEVRGNAIPRLIAASLCEPDGASAITFEMACKLKPAITDQMLRHVRALGKAEAEGKDSKPEAESGSGTR